MYHFISQEQSLRCPKQYLLLSSHFALFSGLPEKLPQVSQDLTCLLWVSSEVLSIVDSLKIEAVLMNEILLATETNCSLTNNVFGFIF